MNNNMIKNPGTTNHHMSMNHGMIPDAMTGAMTSGLTGAMTSAMTSGLTGAMTSAMTNGLSGAMTGGLTNGLSGAMTSAMTSENQGCGITTGMSVYKPKGGGTLISSLRKDNETIESFGSNTRNTGSSKFTEPRQIRTDRSTIENHRKYATDPYQYKEHASPQKGKNIHNKKTHSESESDYASIYELANDVNNSLQALEKLEYNKKKERFDPDSESDYDENYQNGKQSIILDEIAVNTDYLMLLTEFILLLTLYVIMSQPFVVSFASSYIYQLNPTDDGDVKMSGIIIYGLILTIIFMILRKIVYSRM